MSHWKKGRCSHTPRTDGTFEATLLFPFSVCYTEDIKQEYEEEAFAAAESYLDGIGASGDSATMSLLAPDGVSRCVEGRFFLDGLRRIRIQGPEPCSRHTPSRQGPSKSSHSIRPGKYRSEQYVRFLADTDGNPVRICHHILCCSLQDAQDAGLCE